MMRHAFDHKSKIYDNEFTFGLVGRHQRKRVWSYIKQHAHLSQNIKVLEFNGGTGEDAIFMAKQSAQVLTSDISSGMIDIMKQKISEENLEDRIQTMQLDMRILERYNFEGDYDLIFSNFGGINCIAPNELTKLFNETKGITKVGGSFIMVLMPKYTILEWLFCKIKGFQSRWKSRVQGSLNVNVESSDQMTYYYNLADVKACLGEGWKIYETQLIGLIPSYLDHFFTRHRVIFSFVKIIERILITLKIGIDRSDHFLVHLRRAE